MTKENQQQTDLDVSAEEQDKLDANFLEIETLYRSRCITPRAGTNVVVRDIEESDQ